MTKRALLLSVLILILLPVCACGIPTDAYETAIRERDTAQAELKQAKKELDSVRAQLNRMKPGTEGIESPAGTITEIPPSPPRIALAQQILNFDSLRAQAIRTRNELKDENKARQLESEALAVFKTFDSLVNAIGDSELSLAWAETWPQAARIEAEKNNRPGYMVTGWIKFLDRFTILLGEGRNRPGTR